MQTRLLPPEPSVDKSAQKSSDAKSSQRSSGEGLNNRRQEDQPSPPKPQQLPGDLVESARSTPRATPVSQRPQGRPLIGLLLVAFVGFGVFTLWNTFFRFSAFGLVTGTVLEVTPPWAATVRAIYSASGDSVRQGDVIAVLDDPELVASIDQLTDELRVAQANLDAQVALLAIEAQSKQDQQQELLVQFYNLRGQLQTEKSRLDELNSKLTRRQELATQGAVSSEELDSLRFGKAGLRGKIELLQMAVDTLDRRLRSTTGQPVEESRLSPWLAKIEHIQGGIARLRDRQRRGTLRAPVGGTIVAVNAHVGERVTPETPLLDLLQDDSIELVVYVPQSKVVEFRPGAVARLNVEPLQRALECEIVRIGDRFERPDLPGQKLREGENLLPVFLKPPTPSRCDLPLRIGSLVRLPQNWQVMESE